MEFNHQHPIHEVCVIEDITIGCLRCTQAISSQSVGQGVLPLGPLIVDCLSSFSGAHLLSSSKVTCDAAFMSSLNFGPSWMCLELL